MSWNSCFSFFNSLPTRTIALPLLIIVYEKDIFLAFLLCLSTKKFILPFQWFISWGNVLCLFNGLSTRTFFLPFYWFFHKATFLSSLTICPQGCLSCLKCYFIYIDIFWFYGLSTRTIILPFVHKDNYLASLTRPYNNFS